MQRRTWMALAALALLVSTTGCAQLGVIAYFFRPPLRTEEAAYPLKSDAVLVLVDDDQGLIRPPIAREALVDAVARELKGHKVADKVTTTEELARMRQVEPKFEQRGARELGQLAEADTVLLLSTQEFSMEDELELAAVPAKFAVRVRVINAKADKREDVRLWPPELTERDGRLVEGELPPHELRGLKTVPEAHAKLAAELAKKIAELFYDRQVENG